MKKILLIVLSVIMLVCFVACDKAIEEMEMKEQAEYYTITFKNGEDVLKIVDVIKGETINEEDVPILSSDYVWDKDYTLVTNTTVINTIKIYKITYDLTGYDFAYLDSLEQIFKCNENCNVKIPNVNTDTKEFKYWKIKGTDTIFKGNVLLERDIVLVPIFDVYTKYY